MISGRFARLSKNLVTLFDWPVYLVRRRSKFYLVFIVIVSNTAIILRKYAQDGDPVAALIIAKPI